MKTAKQETKLTHWQQAALDAGMTEAEWINGGFVRHGWQTYCARTAQELEMPTYLRHNQVEMFPTPQQELFA